MLRRVLQMTTPRFGMVISPQDDGGFLNEFGTMLEIRNVQMLADGRSIVETNGAYRFRIIEHRILDGYMVARVERCVARLRQELLARPGLGAHAICAGLRISRLSWTARSSARPLRASSRIRRPCASSRPSTVPTVLRTTCPLPAPTSHRRPPLPPPPQRPPQPQR